MQKTFDEVVLFARTGLNPRQNFKLGQGNNYYITIKNIKNNSLVIDDNTDVVNDEAIKLIHKRSQIKKGDILFASIGRMGDMYIIEEEPMVWDINESVFAFTLDTSIVRQKYFYYIFRVKSTLDYLASNSSGSTFKSIKMNQLKKMKFEIPALDKQDQIVAVLDKICNIIEMRKQELGSLDDLIKARFVEMFGDSASNEKGWKMNTFGDICTVRQGLQIPISKRLTEYEEDSYEYITVQYLHGGKEKEYIKSPKESVKCTKDDILMTRTGNTGMVVTNVEGVFHNNFFLIDFDRERFEKDFLVEYLNLDLIQADITRRAGTSTIPDLNHGEFYKIKVFEPPIDLQKEFDEFKMQVDKSKLMFQKLHQKLNILRQKAGNI